LSNSNLSVSKSFEFFNNLKTRPNPIERINREIRRRTRVVGIFPSVASALRLIGMLLLEQTEDWHAGKRYMSEASMDELYARAASA